MRVLEWMLKRIEGQGHAVDNGFGLSPEYADINWEGLNFSADEFAGITSVDPEAWQQEIALHETLFERLKYHLPPALLEIKVALQQRLK
jgi:phosphoenolpyruvate carboxykinase (GTP)